MPKKKWNIDFYKTLIFNHLSFEVVNIRIEFYLLNNKQ